MLHTFSPGDASITIYTTREGVLSPVGHDLAFDAPAFSIRFDDESRVLDADLDTTAITLLGSVNAQGGIFAVSASDAKEITNNLHTKVLATRSHPKAALTAKNVHLDGTSLRGTLSLAGKSREVDVSLERRDAGVLARLSVHQPDFGITPYSAMFGALKVSAEVRVVVELRSLPTSPSRPTP